MGTCRRSKPPPPLPRTCSELRNRSNRPRCADVVLHEADGRGEQGGGGAEEHHHGLRMLAPVRQRATIAPPMRPRSDHGRGVDQGETGVGPSMASGSQVCAGTGRTYPFAPMTAARMSASARRRASRRSRWSCRQVRRGRENVSKSIEPISMRSRKCRAKIRNRRPG